MRLIKIVSEDKGGRDGRVEYIKQWKGDSTLLSYVEKEVDVDDLYLEDVFDRVKVTSFSITAEMFDGSFTTWVLV